MSLATLRPPPKPPKRPVVGICRVCGCTDAEACVTWSSGISGTVKATCSWVERDLCSRCHGPRHPTRRQAGELARIAARVGPFRLGPGILRGELQVHMLALAPIGWHSDWQVYRTLRMDSRGRIRREPLEPA